MIDRAYGCLVGTAIGDAMGMPASFMSPEQVVSNYGRIEGFFKPSEQQTAHQHLDAGNVTDDTEETLIVASVLIEAGQMDPNLFIEKMKKWAIDNQMLESTIIGPSTRRFLNAIIKGEDCIPIGKTGDTNGGAMRAAPIGIYHHGNVDKAIKDAITCTRLSHGSRPGLASACAVAAAVAVAVEGNASVDDVMKAAIKGAEEGESKGYPIPAPSVAARIKLTMELVDKNRHKSLDEIAYMIYSYIGAGMKSYESIPLSLGVFYACDGHAEKSLLTVINIGDDADTNGAITGALAGAYSGIKGFKKEWISKVEDTNNIDFKDLAKSLIK